jgi:serine/threonine-protein kinase HipA
MNCLKCYQPLEGRYAVTGEYHRHCARLIFHHDVSPTIDFPLQEVEEYLLKIELRGAMAGVQTKLSMTYEGKGKQGRLTIVGLWGEYILKPPSSTYFELPQNEDLTMHLAEIAGIGIADHSLVRLEDSSLAYLTRRFDRLTTNRGLKKEALSKLHVEDMCQLTERLTEDKYQGSMEQIGRVIKSFSNNPLWDLLRLFERALFVFLTGNADMHLKNWSLMRKPDNVLMLSPAYDLLSTKLAMPEDDEEMALTLNGKKSNLKRQDFDSFAERIGLPTGLRDNTYRNFKKRIPMMMNFILSSFLSEQSNAAYREIIQLRGERIGLIG